MYKAFARELNDEWFVFHHIKWNDYGNLFQPKGHYQ